MDNRDVVILRQNAPQILRDAIRRNRTNIRRLSIDARVARQSIYNILSGAHLPTRDVMEAICIELGLKLEAVERRRKTS